MRRAIVKTITRFGRAETQRPTVGEFVGNMKDAVSSISFLNDRGGNRRRWRYLVVVDLSLGVLELLEVPRAVDPPVVDEAAVPHAEEGPVGLGGRLGDGGGGVLAEGRAALEGAALLEGAHPLLRRLCRLGDGVHADGADGAGRSDAQGPAGRAGENDLLHSEGSHLDNFEREGTTYYKFTSTTNLR